MPSSLLIYLPSVTVLLLTPLLLFLGCYLCKIDNFRCFSSAGTGASQCHQMSPFFL